MVKDLTIRSARTTRRKPLRHPGDRSQIFPKKSKKKNINRGAFFPGPIGEHFHMDEDERALEETKVDSLLKSIFEEERSRFAKEGPDER